jgi:uncharacterized membrane protein YkoI
MKRKILFAFVSLALLAGAGAGFAFEDHDEAKKLKDAGAILPLEQVLAQARRDRPGRVVETELEKKEKRYVYEIKIVDEQGVVHELKYDAASGRQLKEERER